MGMAMPGINIEVFVVLVSTAERESAIPLSTEIKMLLRKWCVSVLIIHFCLHLKPAHHPMLGIGI